MVGGLLGVVFGNNLIWKLLVKEKFEGLTNIENVRYDDNNG